MQDALSKQIKQYLGASGRTQADLASAAGISEPMMSLISAGLRTPSLEVAVLLSRETGIPVEAFARRVA